MAIFLILAPYGAFTFLNADGENAFKHPMHDLKTYQCALPSLEAVMIPQLPATGGVQAGGQ